MSMYSMTDAIIKYVDLGIIGALEDLFFSTLKKFSY